jgi:putative acyl-CoA dehydrogenase
MGDTHVVVNQPPPLVDYDMAAADPVLKEALAREGGGSWLESVEQHGLLMGGAEAFSWGAQANRNPPVLHTHDAWGNPADIVEYHPSWHSLLGLAVGNGLHSLPWEAGPGDGSHPARAALTFLASQVEAGHFCPVSMTTSAVPLIRRQPDLALEWTPLQLSRSYDPSLQPGPKKAGVMMGMGMTEKQGGSDVRTNTTRATPIGGGHDGEYLLTGHKWFMSAPMSDAFLVLANTEKGLSCFFLPRFTPDGEVNGIRLQRLKDKLGNRSNASSEAEFESAWALLIGEQGRGVAEIIEMVAGTRLDCVTGSAALMRQAVTQAVHHTVHRQAFGSPLVEKPLMRNVLADLEIEAEAAVLLMMRLAGAFDRAPIDEAELRLRRILTPLAKYWVTKRCSEVVREALECLGGNGYVEESIMPRLYRESPVNAIWEGSGNVIALDLVRVISGHPEAVDALEAELDAGLGADPRLDGAIRSALDLTRAPTDAEYEARRLAEGLALSVSGALLARHGRPEVWRAFASSRLSPDRGYLYGTLPVGLDLAAIIEPAIPRI